MNRTIQGACEWARLLVIGLVIPVFLAAGVGAGEEASEEEIPRLIKQLGDPDYAVRDRAQEILGDMGEKAYNALTHAANDPDLEIAARARYLLLRINLPLVRDTDSDQVKEILGTYLDVSTTEQLFRVRRLMGLPAGDGYRAACRLVHVERSPAMSKLVATMILNRCPVHDEGLAQLVQAIETELPRSGRVASQWLTTYAELLTDPKSDLAGWREMVEKEDALFQQQSLKSDATVVAILLDDLVYRETLQGFEDSAQQHFQRAQEVRRGVLIPTVSLYLDTAYFYRMRGQVEWAAAVYGHLTSLGYPQAVPYGQLGLAEMYHDVARHKDAADAMDVILKLLDTQQLPSLAYMDHSEERVKGRKHFFLASQAKADGDDAKYREELTTALKEDPTELDALIATYQLPDLDEAAREKTVAMIEVAADALRQEAELADGEPSSHNEFAWLVGNTTGDMQEALRHAQRAVELRPESGAYLDTLAHVYFYGLKDYDKAVEWQEKAVKFMPNAPTIRKKYDLFRKTAAEAKAQSAEDGPGENDRS